MFHVRAPHCGNCELGPHSKRMRKVKFCNAEAVKL